MEGGRDGFPDGDGGGPDGGILTFEGILDGVDLEERLIFIETFDDEFLELTPAEGFVVEDRNGRPVDVGVLIELSFTLPEVLVEVNEDDELLRMIIFSRIDKEFLTDDEGPAPSGDEFFGQVGLIDGDGERGKIILQGPRFAVTSRTGFADQNNKRIDSLGDLPVGQLVSITPGPPDFSSGSSDPTAVRVQVLNPRRPPPPRSDVVIGNLIGIDPLELAGPISEFNAETVALDFEGNPIDLFSIEAGIFVSIVTRPPSFGEGEPVAVEVIVLEEGVVAPPPEEGDEGMAGRPTDEIQVEGAILDVDPDGRFLALEGERLELDGRVLVFDLDGSRASVDDLFPGDLLEFDTRPGGRSGFVVTRIKVIDPTIQTFDRPGVIVGSFEDVIEVDGIVEMVLSGPFFAVPTDADIALRGGRDGGLGDLEPGQFVRVAASPPRFDRGESLPVAFEIRVVAEPQFVADEPQQGEDPQQGQGNGGAKRRLLGSFPEDGDVEIPTFTKVELSFNGSVRDLFFDPQFDFFIIPEPLGFGELEVSRDGRSVGAEVELEADKVYQLVLISGQTGFVSIHFSTGEEISEASVFAEFILPEGLPRNAKVLPEESFAVLLSGLPDGDLDPEEFDRLVVAGTPLFEPEATFSNIAPGTYFLGGFVAIEVGRGEFFELEVFTEDPIVVGEGEAVEVEVELLLPEALEVVSLLPELKAVGVELETTIEIEFNVPAFLHEEDVLIIPPPLDILAFDVDDSGTLYTIEVELEEDTAYRVLVETAEDEEGGELIQPASTVFTTATDFGATRELGVRLILPQLPANRVFDGPILVGLVPLDLVDVDDFGLKDIAEEDIAASTVAFGPEAIFENVPAGEFVAAAFVPVQVPRGFRPPDPRQRPLEEFSVLGGRYNEQALEVFDTIELFGVYGDGNTASVIDADTEEIEIFLRGESKSRQQILNIKSIALNGEALDKETVEAGLAVVEAGDVEIGVAFNKPLRVGRGIIAVEAALNGEFLDPSGRSEDGQVVFFAVNLPDGEFFKFSVFDAEGNDGSRLEESLDIGFSTGAEDISFGSIAGSVELETQSSDGTVLTGDDADVIDEAKILLFAESSEDLALISVADLANDGTFQLTGIVAGDYLLSAEILTASGQEITSIALVELDDGEDFTGVELTGVVVISTTTDEETGVATKTTPAGGNATALVTFDLDPEAGNQGKTTLTDVDIDQEITVDVYISGATDLSGVAVKLRSEDEDVLEFLSATDATGSESNFLRSAGARALYLSPIIRGTEIEYGGAALGTTAETAPDGDGFIARYTFKTKGEFSGVQIFLEEATLNSVIGQDILAPGLSAKLAPPVFEEQQKDIISFDFNTDAEDQEMFHKGFITAGDLVTVDVYINFDKIQEKTGTAFTDLTNFSVTVDFAPTELTYVSYSADTPAEGNLLLSKGGLSIPLPAIVTETTVSFGNALLNTTAETSPDSSGLLGRLTFATDSDFSQSDLLITKYAYKSAGGSQVDVESLIIGRTSTGEISPVARGSASSSGGGAGQGAAGADFDGDGQVSFGDFFQFADAFGQPGTGDFARFDLDGDGQVSFGDFFIFADTFGQPVASKRVITAELPVVDGALELVANSDAEGLLLDLSNADLPLDGFGLVVEYDPQVFRFVEVDETASVLRTDSGQPLLLTQEDAGQVLVVAGQAGRGASVEGLLAQLRFAPLSPEAVGSFRIGQATVRDERGQLVQPQQLAQIEARWEPQVFALQPNYPNPFNPSTTISYQLPARTAVQLDIYDVLGQKVRTLVASEQAAGHYKVAWDSRNERGLSVAAGVYFYRLEAGEFSHTRKLLLLK